HHARQPRPHATAAWGHASIYGASLSAAARGRGIAATPPALAEDRDVRSEPRGKRSAAGCRAQRASRRCPALAPPPPSRLARVELAPRGIEPPLTLPTPPSVLPAARAAARRPSAAP